MRDECIYDLMQSYEDSIKGVSTCLANATADLAQMEMDDSKEYANKVRMVSNLTEKFTDLMNGYDKITNPKKDYDDKPWYKKLDVSKILCCIMACGFSMTQSLMIYKWQRDGYLIARDAAKIQMPRPY